ncbi:MBL fold metallo-hydrolase [Paenibacillus sp. P25]|nr:MBL fold metallo-hydrolase [Paenibacillus sp. P25]
MSLHIQMIGTGSAFAKRYYNNNALVRTEGFTLLIDCGVTAPRALYELNVPLTDIDAVLITHIHADHVGGSRSLRSNTGTHSVTGFGRCCRSRSWAALGTHASRRAGK